jgi:hypothetical protein
MEEILATDAQLVACAAAAHARQTAAWPNFTHALEKFQSTAFTEGCAAIKKRNERAAGKFTKAEHRLKKAQECVLSYYLEPKENRLGKIEVVNVAAEDASTESNPSSEKTRDVLFDSPEEFLDKHHSSKSQLGW